MTNVQSIFSENTESYFTEKGLRHFVFAYDKEVSEYMSKILFLKIRSYFLIYMFLTHVKEMSVHMSKILFSNNGILFFDLHLL